MAVEMVRKPSETPNIENVDDFMPIRYAYANQNGYVIGRGRIGTGIDAEAYTINGNTFTINSGRLVLQGVECDIDTGHAVTIDVNSTKRYCAIYLEVNLATNTSDIFVAYDMLGTPSVDAGDDLTANKIGTARMVLFTCEATNGLISNVIKVVKACEYSIPYKLDENGVLRYGDIVIPQRKVLWSDDNGAASARWTEELKIGDVVEVTYSLWTGRTTCKMVCYKNPYPPNDFTCRTSVRDDFLVYTTNYYQAAFLGITETTVNIQAVGSNYDYPLDPLIYKVVKVIE